MNIAKEHKQIDTALNDYRRWIDEIPDEQFEVTPPNGGWSYAEVYSHIMQASLGSSIAAEKCCRNTGTNTGKGLNWLGKFAFLFNYFPTSKAKPPQAIANLTKKITKEDARNLIIRLRKRVDETLPLFANAAGSNKISHPLLGMLNAPQWLKFTRLHLQHHLKQLQRIKESFPHR